MSEGVGVVKTVSGGRLARYVRMGGAGWLGVMVTGALVGPNGCWRGRHC